METGRTAAGAEAASPVGAGAAPAATLPPGSAESAAPAAAAPPPHRAVSTTSRGSVSTASPLHEASAAPASRLQRPAAVTETTAATPGNNGSFVKALNSDSSHQLLPQPGRNPKRVLGSLGKDHVTAGEPAPLHTQEPPHDARRDFAELSDAGSRPGLSAPNATHVTPGEGHAPAPAPDGSAFHPDSAAEQIQNLVTRPPGSGPFHPAPHNSSSPGVYPSPYPGLNTTDPAAGLHFNTTLGDMGRTSLDDVGRLLLDTPARGPAAAADLYGLSHNTDVPYHVASGAALNWTAAGNATGGLGAAGLEAAGPEFGLPEYLWIYVAPMILVIGCIGNILILLVMAKGKFKGQCAGLLPSYPWQP